MASHVIQIIEKHPVSKTTVRISGGKTSYINFSHTHTHTMHRYTNPVNRFKKNKNHPALVVQRSAVLRRAGLLRVDSWTPEEPS